jgi:LPXTG-motif cell wall-anchored protein
MKRLVALAFAAVLFMGVGTAGASTKTINVSDFTGAASSHAVKIDIGNISLTVGGGQSNAAYQMFGDQLRNIRADAASTGLVIPGVMDSKVACVPPKLTDSLVGLATPASLAPLLSAQLAMASCGVSVKQLPTANHKAGLLDAAITLTPDIVGDTSAVDSVLSTVQGQLGALPADVRAKASNVISAIKARLASDPVLEIQVAPNSGVVTSTKDGLTSVSPGTAVTLSVLGGVLQIQIAVADATAQIVNGVPQATADAGFVHIKALDITNSGAPLIDQTISIPQDISLLQGTPLALNVVTTRGTTSTTCDGSLAGFNACARGTADAVSLRLLSAPLPTIGVSLVHAQALAAEKVGTHTDASSPSLPRTGAAAGMTVLAGLALAGGALVVRRYVIRVR